MKYQSELIKEIVDSRGHDKSSLHYQSECAETWIEEVKGAYPKLCDYEAEWLNYISILDDTGGPEKPEPDPDPEPPIGQFPYVALTDVTEATVDNVVPYAYKTAILKGATLRNLITNPSEEKIAGLSSQTKAKYNYINKIDLSKEYTLQFTISNFSGSTIGFNYSLNSGMIGEEIAIKGDGTYKILSKPSNLTGTQLWLFWSKKGWTATNTATISNVVLIEGDYTNVDISYFEGMKSIQMPVLTTTNEDGSETNILTVNEDIELRGIGDVQDKLNLLTGEVTQRIGEVVLDGTGDWQGFSFDATNNKATARLHLPDSDSIVFNKSSDVLVSDKLKTSYWAVNRYEVNSVFRWDSPQPIIGITLSGDNDINTFDKFKSFLSKNPVKVYYQRITPPVKTVNLTVVNQDGETMSKIKPIEGTMHLSTSSNTIPPLFSGEIPVEAITQNLASFIEG